MFYLLFLSVLRCLELKHLFYLLSLSFLSILELKPLFYLSCLSFLTMFYQKPLFHLLLLVFVIRRQKEIEGYRGDIAGNSRKQKVTMVGGCLQAVIYTGKQQSKKQKCKFELLFLIKCCIHNNHGLSSRASTT